MHTLGLAGNYTIPLHLQSALNEYGLRVRHLGGRSYKVESDTNDLSIDQLAPSFIDRDGHVFDLKNLHHFGEFLHQPTKSSLKAMMPEVKKASDFRARVQQTKAQEAQLHEDRTAIHRMLRFAVTGSVEIPPDEEEGLDKETAECHAQTEQAIRDGDTWRSAIEFGNAEDTISSIPNTAFNPRSGFHIQLPSEKKEFDGKHQNTLNETFWRLIDYATAGKCTSDDTEIVLSGNELEKFCLAAERENLSGLIDRVEFEEAVQEKLEAVQKRISKLSTSSILGNNEDSRNAQLRELMDASSSLTPFLAESYMRDAMARVKFTERHSSPLEGLAKEMSVFTAVADLYARQDNVTPAQMEAIATEFYSLIAFSGHITEAIDDGLAKEAVRDPENTQIQQEREKYDGLKSKFYGASVASVDLDAKFLSDEQRDALEVLQKYAGKPGSFGDRVRSAVKAPLNAGGETFLDFAGDVVNFIREDPKIAAGFVALAATLIYMKGGDPSCTIPNINELGELVDMAVDCDLIPQELFGDDPYHWDLKFNLVEGYYLAKHFANSNFISGPSYEAMNWLQDAIHAAYSELGLPTDIDNAFIQNAEAVIGPLSDSLFDVNMFQNVSHAAFWMWAFSRGYDHGPRGFSKLFELAGPVTNLGVQAGGAVFDQFRPQTVLSQHLLNLQKSQPIAFKYDGKFTPEDLIDALGEAAEIRSDVEAILPEDIQSFTTILTIDALKTKSRQIDGLTRTFKISAENFKPTLDALSKFDHFMSHAGSCVVAHEKWHINPLIERIQNVQIALKDFAVTHDAQALNHVLDENLEYILASELRYRGERSEIYEALFDAAPDKEAFKRLMRSANKTIGKEKRENSIQKTRALMRGEGEQPLRCTEHLTARAKIAGINLWGGMVKTAKTLRRGTDRVVNKRNIIIGAGFAAACVGLDLAGAGNEFSDAVSGLTGGSVATGTTTALFLNYNFWEDIVGVHIGTGIALMFSGAASGLVYKRGIRPAVTSALETKSGSYINSAWGNSSKALSGLANHISGTIDKKNREWGQALTRNARSRSQVAWQSPSL